MRLIDADKLLKYMETTEISQYIDEINKGNDNYSSTALYGYIKEMPTAYDVDKVVEKVSDYYDLIPGWALKEIIENVKSGALNETLTEEN